MTWEEIDESFDIAPVWINYWLTIYGLNMALDLSKTSPHYNYSLEEFRTKRISCSSGINIKKSEDWKVVMK